MHCYLDDELKLLTSTLLCLLITVEWKLVLINCVDRFLGTVSWFLNLHVSLLCYLMNFVTGKKRPK